MLRVFFEANQVLIYFVYGLVFVLMGFGALLAAHTFRESRLAVVRTLPWLAAFGMLVGAAEWGVVFIPLQASYLSPGWLTALHVLHAGILLAAHACLLTFGVMLLARWEPVRLWLPASLAAGVVAVTLTIPPASLVTDLYLAAHVVAAYGLGLPGAVLSARGLLLQRRDVAAFYPRSARWLGVAAWAFILSVPIGPLAVPEPGDAPFTLWGIPVQVPLALGGLVLAWSLLAGLDSLRVENARRVERAERREAMLEERYRLAKELNDGVIQDLFASGMLLGAAGLSLPDAERAPLQAAERQLQAIVDRLRLYVMDLDPANPADADLYVGMQRLVDDFRANTLLPVSLFLEPDLHTDRAVLATLYTVAGEALSNIRRHARATLVSFSLYCTRDGVLCFMVADNGRGLPPEGARGPGMDRMARAAEAAGAILTVGPAPGGGARVMLQLPDYIQDNTNESRST